MKPDTVQWVLSGLITIFLMASSYVALDIIPKVSALEVRAVHLEHANAQVAAKLEQISGQLNEISIKLAKIEGKL